LFDMWRARAGRTRGWLTTKNPNFERS
jgi:hypothetical protein